MQNQIAEVGWTDAQWSRVSQVVSEEVNKGSVAGGFLPCYGPLSRSAELVRKEKVEETDPPPWIRVDDVETINLWTLAVHVHLKQQQLAEEDLAGALSAFRRGANLLARAEDTIVFNTVPQPPLPPPPPPLAPFNIGLVRVTGPALLTGSEGLVEEGKKLTVGSSPIARTGEELVQAVAEAIVALEKNGHLGPFACVLGDKVFVVAHTPLASMVMPSDRMEPLLGMPLLRSGTIPDDEGIVVSLAGDPIDLVVATAPAAQFLLVTDDPEYVFRVYERFALRIKEDNAVSWFELMPESTPP